jgi:hypothetical protein
MRRRNLYPAYWPTVLFVVALMLALRATGLAPVGIFTEHAAAETPSQPASREQGHRGDSSQ